MTSIQLPDHVAEQLDSIARRTGRRKDELISDLIADYLDAEEELPVLHFHVDEDELEEVHCRIGV